jgi:hypothetical protein
VEKLCDDLSTITLRATGALRVSEITPRANFLFDAVVTLLQRGQLLDAFHYCGKAAWLVDMAMTRLAADSVRLQRLLANFESLHFRIASERPVDPATLAERIFALQVSSAHDFLLTALEQYRGLLGETGMKAYRKQLDRVYRVAVDGEPLDKQSQPDLRRHMQESKLLRAWGAATSDPREAIAIRMAFARTPQEVLEIAATLGRQEAIDAILLACDRFQNPPPVALFEHLVAHFDGEGQFDRALEYRWELYRAQPSEESYRRLVAAAAPLRQVEETRDSALDLAAGKNNSLYTRLLLLEGRRDEALDQARAHGATTEVWALLAAAFAPTDPHTAIHLYFDCAKYSMRAFRQNSYRLSSQYMGEAWKLAIDVQTFQTFDARLKTFFGQNYCPPRLQAAVQDAGVPLDRLLKQ